MEQTKLYKALTSRFSESEAQEIVAQIASLESQNLDRMKEVFATKDDLRVLYKDLSSKIDNKIDKVDNKIDKIYWFILGQTVALVGLFMAILRLVQVI